MPCDNCQFRAVVGLFTNVLMKILTRKARIAARRVRGVRVDGVAAKLAVTTLLVMLFIGGVESNPGPGSVSSDTSDMSNEASKFDQLTEMVSRLTQSMTRVEAGQTEQTSHIDQRLTAMESVIGERFREVSEAQAELARDMDILHDRCENLQSENSQLHDKVSTLEDKLDYLENQSRRNNLLFYGIPTVSNEMWSDCEEKVKDVLHRLLGISHVSIERAHRVGSAIIAKFSSYKDRDLVLSRCNRLQGGQVSVSEDVSATVREKQKGLVPLKRELRGKGMRARIRFDKLHTDEGVFTYDLSSKRVKKLNANSRANPSVQSGMRNTPEHPPSTHPTHPTHADDRSSDSDPDMTYAKKLCNQSVFGGMSKDGGGGVGGASADTRTPGMRKDKQSGSGGGRGHGGKSGYVTPRRPAGRDKQQHSSLQPKITEHVSRADMSSSQVGPLQGGGEGRSQSAKRQRVSDSPGSQSADGSGSVECVSSHL